MATDSPENFQEIQQSRTEEIHPHDIEGTRSVDKEIKSSRKGDDVDKMMKSSRKGDEVMNVDKMMKSSRKGDDVEKEVKEIKSSRRGDEMIEMKSSRRGEQKLSPRGDEMIEMKSSRRGDEINVDKEVKGLKSSRKGDELINIEKEVKWDERGDKEFVVSSSMIVDKGMKSSRKGEQKSSPKDNRKSGSLEKSTDLPVEDTASEIRKSESSEDIALETTNRVTQRSRRTRQPSRFFNTGEPVIYSRWEKKQMKNFGSINYQTTRSKVYQDFCREELSGQSPTYLWRWFGFLMIALIMSVTAFTLKIVTSEINEVKLDFFIQLLNKGEITNAYLFFVGVSLGLIIISSYMVVFFEPAAVGSGIPEVIGYLNGVHIPGVFTAKVYVAKMISVIASVSSGLPLGPEGPMIHIGGVVGASVQSRNTPLRWIVPWYQFRNQEDKRQFMLGGVASGVAAAFNAPIGGLAFAWEEISSFWQNGQNWMILFTCMLSAFCTNLLLSLANTGTATFNTETIIFSVPPVDMLAVWIILPAAVIGVLGGLLGVVFSWIALFLCRIKRTYLQNRYLKLLEPCIIVILFMSIGFFFPFAFHCIPDPTDPQPDIPPNFNSTFTNVTLIDNSTDSGDVSQWICQDGYYNPMASLALIPGHEIITGLLRYDNAGYYPIPILLVFLVYYFLFSAWCSGGVAMASGFVVPMLCIGAIYGRVIGEIMLMICSETECNHYSGMYALLGSAAFFGGVSRLSISLTIIMIELSGDILLAFPIMVSIMMAKNVADTLIHSMYHAQLALKGVPYLDDVASMSGVELLRAKDVMSENVIVLHRVERLRTLERLLKSCQHSAFPVVSMNSNYVGIIQRKELLILLSQPDIFMENPQDRAPNVLTYKQMKIFREIKGKNDVEVSISPENIKKYIDIGPYINTGVYAIPRNFFLKETYGLFRTMALTHLVVVNEKNQLSGIITRKDLLGENIVIKKELRKRTITRKSLAPPKDRFTALEDDDKPPRRNENEQPNGEVDITLKVEGGLPPKKY